MTINGGYIVIDVAGDGVDSNGSITMTNGTVIVNDQRIVEMVP